MKSLRALMLLLCLTLAVALYSKAILAQGGTATLGGRITDQAGLAVSGARVEATNTDTNAIYPAETNEAGIYHIPALLPGSYRLSVRKEGFEQLVQSGIELHVADSVAVDLALTVGSVSQSVTVEGGVPLVDTTTSSIGGLVNEDRMAELPLNGRNYVDLTLIQPGVTEDKAFRYEGGQGGKAFSVNGATPWSNYFTLDGAPLVNALSGSSAGAAGTTLGVDGIKEFKVITSGVSAEYFSAMGGQVVMVSKGGNNQFHGDVFEYLRNSIFDARNFYDYGYLNGGPRLPNLSRNDFGASFGGPIKKDKIFFYAVYEGLKQSQGISTIDTVMGANCHGSAGAVVWNGQGTQPGGSIGPCTQLGVNPAGSGTNSVTIFPTVAPILALFPLPNLPNNQFTFASADPTGINYGQIRVDENFSESDTIFARYTVSNDSLNASVIQTTLGNPAYPGFRMDYAGRDQFVTAAENHIFSPTTLNVARFSYTTIPLLANPLFPAGVSGPQYSFTDYNGVGNPIGTLTLGGISGPFGSANNRPSSNSQEVYTGSDDLFLTRNNHALKFGVLFNRYYDVVISPAKANGDVNFSSVATFLRGLPSSYDAITPGSPVTLDGGYPVVQRNYAFNTLGFYAQDDWRAAARLTLNLGLRYEFRTNVIELNGLQAALRNVGTDAATTPGPIMDDPTYKNFSPRVGFAYDLTGKGKTAIRGGFGMYYDLANIGAEFREEISGAPPLLSASTNSAPTSFTLPFQFTPAQVGKSFGTVSYNARPPYALSYNVTGEQQLPFGMGLSVSFVGQRGKNLWTRGEGNPVIPTSITNGVEFYAPSVSACAGVVPTCRVNPNWASITFDQNTATSWYKSLQVNLVKRLAHGVEFQSAFTMGQAVDDTATQGGEANTLSLGCGTATDPLNRLTDKGPSCNNATYNFRFNLLYHFPKVVPESSFASKFLNGWWIGNLVSIQSGYPYTPVLTTNRSRSGVLSSNADRANINTAASIAATFPSTCTSLPGQPAAGSNPCLYTPIPYNSSTITTGNPNQWFNPAMFSLGPVGMLGNAGRDMLSGPGLRDWDFSIVKDTALKFLGESGSLQFRAELFNILNNVNFGIPNGTTFTGSTADAGPYSELPSSVAGQITNTVTTSRQIQFALKLIF